jgi:hypothetical protein
MAQIALQARRAAPTHNNSWSALQTYSIYWKQNDQSLHQVSTATSFPPLIHKWIPALVLSNSDLPRIEAIAWITQIVAQPGEHWQFNCSGKEENLTSLRKLVQKFGGVLKEKGEMVFQDKKWKIS